MKKIMLSGKKLLISVIIAIMLIAVGVISVWYVIPENVTVYVSYPYRTNGTFQVSIDNHVLAYEKNYSFDYLPPYTVGYEKSLGKGAHIILISDMTYNHTADQRFDLWSKLYIIVSINENGIRFLIQNKQPQFL